MSKAGWETKRFDEFCTLQRGFDLPTQDRKAGKFPLVSSSGISDTHDEAPVLAPGVVTGRSGSIGNVFYIEDNFWPLNTTLYVRDFHGNSPRFVYYLLIAFDLKKYAGGTGVPTLNRNDVHSVQIFVPNTLKEQHRIVAILDAAFDHIATARANCEANLLNARAIFESYLEEAFNNKSWKTIQLQDACAEIFAGGDAPKENFSLEKSEKFTIPIFANAVKKNGLYGYTNFARVTKPSITISARGSGTGHTEIRFESFLPIVRLIVLIPNAAVINLEFLKYSIDNLEILRSGSAIPQLTVPMIKEYHIPLPTLSEQLEIISKLEIFCAETQRLESLYQRKLQALDDLKKSLLHQAFSGAL